MSKERPDSSWCSSSPSAASIPPFQADGSAGLLRPHRRIRQSKLKSLRRARKRLSQEDFRSLITISSAHIVCFELSQAVPCGLSQDAFVEALYNTPSRCLEASLTFAIASGFATVDEVIGRAIPELLPQHDGFAALFAKWHGLSLSGQGFESLVRSHNGASLSMHSVVYGKIVDERLERLWVVQRDITPQARAINALLHIERHYRSLMEGSDSLLFRIRPDSTFEYASHATKEIFGICVETLLRSPTALWTLIHPEDTGTFDAAMKARHSLSSIVSQAELRMRTKNGEYHLFSLRQHPKLSPSGEVEHYDILVTDIEKWRAPQKQSMLMSKAAWIGQIAAGIVHDLNNHLAIVQCHLEASQQLVDAQSPIASRLRHAQEVVTDCRDIGQQLLSGSRLHSQELPAINLQAVLARSLRLLSYLIPARITVALHMPEATIWVRANSLELQQVIFNLVLNARDAISGAGEIDITLQAPTPQVASSSQPTERAPNLACILVRDSGAGISDQNAGRIFEPFFSTKSSNGGNGLGLCMVKTIVEGLNGSVFFASEGTGGTTFSITLPAAEPIDVEGPSEPSTVPACRPAGSALRVVIADDEADIRSTLVDVLSRRGCTVTSVATASALTAHLSSLRDAPDILVMDNNLPDQQGFQLIPEITKMYPSLRIILASGLPPDLEPGFSLPEHVQVLNKPFSFVDIVRMLDA